MSVANSPIFRLQVKINAGTMLHSDVLKIEESESWPSKLSSWLDSPEFYH